MEHLFFWIFSLLSVVLLGACTTPATPTPFESNSGGQERVSEPVAVVVLPTQPSVSISQAASEAMYLSVSSLNSIPPQDILAEVTNYSMPGGGDGPQPIDLASINKPSLILDGKRLLLMKFKSNENVRLFVYRRVGDTHTGKLLGWTTLQVDGNGMLTMNIDNPDDTFVAIGEITGDVYFQYQSGDMWRWERIVKSDNPPTQTAVRLEIYYPLSGCAGSRLHFGDVITVESAAEYVTIRNTPDTHPHDNKIGKILAGEQAEIIDGPVCNYGWILWKIRKNSDGMTGWIPESDGKEFWFMPVQ